MNGKSISLILWIESQNKTEQKKVKTFCGAASLPYFSDVIKTKDRSSLLS